MGKGSGSKGYGVASTSSPKDTKHGSQYGNTYDVSSGIDQAMCQLADQKHPVPAKKRHSYGK